MTLALASELLQCIGICLLSIGLVLSQLSIGRLRAAHDARDRARVHAIAELEREIERLDHRQRERDEEIRRRIRADNEARRRVLGAVRGESSR